MFSRSLKSPPSFRCSSLLLRRSLLAGGFICALLLPDVARAQWESESFTIKAGWNAIWVGLDCTHATVADSLSGLTDIEEVWRWNPPSGVQFVSSPSTPVQPNTSWNVWKRSSPTQSTLASITANSAYLIKLRDGAPNLIFSLKGRPTRPDYPWTTTGVNLVGFPVSTTVSTFTNFLSFGAAFAIDPTVLAYRGGALSNVVPKNPVAVINASEPVVRGQAYWVQATQYTDFYGPVGVQIAERSGLNFGRNRVSVSLRLKNAVAASRAQTLTVTLTPVASETPPAILAGTATMGSGTTAGRVASIAPNLNSSYTYATTPTVTLSAPAAGTTATATATLDSTGRIASFTVTNSGAGYGATTPTVSVTPSFSAAVPLKIRGAFDPTTSSYAYTSLATAQTITLTPGQETEVILVADRSAMGTTAGTLYGSLLRITDSLGLTRIDVPVTAVTSDFTGLWTGVASLNLVDQVKENVSVAALSVQATAVVTGGFVTSVTVNSDRAYFTSTPTVGFVGGGGTGATATAVLTKNILTSITVTSPGTGYTTAPTVAFTGGQFDVRTTASVMPLRLIVHRAANGDTRLVQQAYIGSDGITTTLATAETLFPFTLKPSTRISSAQFPSDFVKLGTGSLSSTGTVSFEVLLDYDADTNPFVHRYHPDHDNLDALFSTKLPVGRESLTVRRVVTLAFQSNLPGITDPTWGVTMIGGTYTEVVTGLRAVPVTVSGTFILYRVSDGPTLLTP